MSIKAMIFAAGLGTRLRPLTNDRPKALVEVEGMPLLDIQLLRLKAFGFQEVVVNIHHYADKMVAHLRDHDYGLRIYVSDERELLLDTGGGLLHARHFLEDADAIYLCNVDVLTDLDPNKLIELHQQNDALATLSLRDRPSDRYLIFDADMKLCGWENRRTGEVKGKKTEGCHSFAFSGLHIVSPKIFPQITQTGVFSIIDTYLDLASTGRILGHLQKDGIWLDVGKPPELAAAADLLPKILF
jgi:NDP-sugar pyrophosphorylase family protein